MTTFTSGVADVQRTFVLVLVVLMLLGHGGVGDVVGVEGAIGVPDALAVCAVERSSDSPSKIITRKTKAECDGNGESELDRGGVCLSVKF